MKSTDPAAFALDLAERIDQLCLRFEKAWRNEEKPFAGFHGSAFRTDCSSARAVFDRASAAQHDNPVGTAPHGYVKSVAFSADGTQLYSGSGDFTVRIWDTRTR